MTKSSTFLVTRPRSRPLYEHSYFASSPSISRPLGARQVRPISIVFLSYLSPGKLCLVLDPAFFHSPPDLDNRLRTILLLKSIKLETVSCIPTCRRNFRHRPQARRGKCGLRLMSADSSLTSILRSQITFSL